MSLCCWSSYKLTLTCTLLLEHTWCAHCFPSMRIMLLLSEQSDGAKSCLAHSLNSVVMVTETSWQLECISLENKTSAKHYASTRAASLLLMDINIYMVWKIFSWRRRAGGLWRAETWADQVVCVKHLWLSCVDAQVHLAVPFNLTYENNNVGFKWTQEQSFTELNIHMQFSISSPAILQICIINLWCGDGYSSMFSRLWY